LNVSVVRRNLQREQLKDLTKLVIGPSPADARSLARGCLKKIGGRIEKELGDKGADSSSRRRQ
jgi:hypothetical protein